MKVTTLVVGQLQTNCYLVQDGAESIIIDPGDDGEYIRQTVLDLDSSPALIIATHGHFDHLLAVNELKAAFRIPFVMHSADKLLLRWYRKSTILYTGFDPGPAPIVDQFLTDNKPVTPNIRLKVFTAPGHTPGGVCLYNNQEKIIFTGDTLFAGGNIGRYDFPYSNKKELLKSVGKIKKSFRGYRAYPGHGPNFDI